MTWLIYGPVRKIKLEHKENENFGKYKSSSKGVSKRDQNLER